MLRTPEEGVYELVVGVALIMQLEQVDTIGSEVNALGSVETKMRYEVAPLTGDQVKLGVVDTPVKPLAGELRAGAGKINVVKLRC